jgi:hypothetical protein
MLTRTHTYAGSDSERAAVGSPGHCSESSDVGHVVAHPELGCGDVGCDKVHPTDEG